MSPAARHALLGLGSLLAAYLFRIARLQWHPMHAWNRAFADVAFLLLVLSLAAGPLARLWPATRALLTWRRELGIWSGVATVLHVLIILDGWVEWQPLRFFVRFEPVLQAWVLDTGPFGLGNVVGTVALAYMVLLVLTSNDWSLRLLGWRAWKFVQQRAYTLHVLVALHVAFFLFFLPPNRTNFLRGPFLVLVIILPILQACAFIATWRRQVGRSSQGRNPNLPAPADKG